LLLLNFTLLSLFSCTDGVSFWQLEIDEDDLKAKVSTSEVVSIEEFLSRIKSAMESSEVQVSIKPQTLTVLFGSRAAIISLDLYETTAQEKKEEIKILLFTLVDRVKDLEKKLESADSKLKDLEDSAKVAAVNTSPFKDQSLHKANMTSRPKRIKGQSVINPGSKRRAAAKGVVFE